MKNVSKFMEKYYLKLLFIIIPLLLLFVILFFLRKIDINNHKYTTEKGRFYQYFAGKRYDYSGVITIDNNKILEIKLGNTKISDYSSPLYYSNSDRFILPANMSVVNYEGQTDAYLLNYFTEIYKTNNYFMASFSKKEKVISNQFLYDGYDTYLFLEDVDLYVGESKYSLTPMSYVIAQYNGPIEIYKYGEDPIVLGANEYVHVKFKSVDIDLIEDILNNGVTTHILYSRVKDLEPFVK